jgi:hypothetical protein
MLIKLFWKFIKTEIEMQEKLIYFMTMNNIIVEKGFSIGW